MELLTPGIYPESKIVSMFGGEKLLLAYDDKKLITSSQRFGLMSNAKNYVEIYYLRKGEYWIKEILVPFLPTTNLSAWLSIFSSKKLPAILTLAKSLLEKDLVGTLHNLPYRFNFFKPGAKIEYTAVTKVFWDAFNRRFRYCMLTAADLLRNLGCVRIDSDVLITKRVKDNIKVTYVSTDKEEEWYEEQLQRFKAKNHVEELSNELKSQFRFEMRYKYRFMSISDMYRGDCWSVVDGGEDTITTLLSVYEGSDICDTFWRNFFNEIITYSLERSSDPDALISYLSDILNFPID